MSINDAYKNLFGKQKPGSRCPDEVEMLAYSAGQLSPRRRAQLEGHFEGCQDCRELLALFTQVSDDAEGVKPSIGILPEEQVRDQAARVLTFIKQDEFNQGQSKLTAAAKEKSRFRLSFLYMSLGGLVLGALVVAGVYLLTGERPAEVAAMQALSQAVKDGRRIEPRVSGDLHYSPYRVTRGRDDSEQPRGELEFDIAKNKLKFAENRSAKPAARLVLARVLLAHGKRADAERALALLEELDAGGLNSAELYNDLGVAHFQLDNYPAAIDKFNKALDQSPRYNEALFNLALVEQRAGNVPGAREYWNRFLEASADQAWKDEAKRNLDSL